MKIRIWGSRGSTPVTGAKFARYGGDTTCVEVMADDGQSVILDAGSGLRTYAAKALKENGPPVCLTHLHFDHAQGLPFYPPMFTGKVKLFGPRFRGGPAFEENIAKLFDGVFFPVYWRDLKGVEAIDVYPRSGFKLGSLMLETAPVNHPGGGLAWKISADGVGVVYVGDHEIPLPGDDEAQAKIHAELLDFIDGADLVIADAHFSREDHERRRGWGHSDFLQWLDNSITSRVGSLLFTHFSPDYDDEKIDCLLAKCHELAPDIKMAAARPGLVVDLGEKNFANPVPQNFGDDFLTRVSRLSDTYSIVDALLSEGRRLSDADAGTVYLLDKDELVFAAAQNDTLFPASAANKFAYMNARVPLNRSSVAGYVAASGFALNIDDVYSLDPALEYGFNDSFDRKTGYRTRSMLCAPLVNGDGKIIGVLQLINGSAGGFDENVVARVSRLANLATLPLEKAFLMVNMIKRMLRTSALRDPSETSAHVQRVGNVAAELYHRWALARGVDPEELLANKSRLRLAAMLHDIGKVGIPDGVLKKPGRLTDEERAVMQTHSALGAGLFNGDSSELEAMARDIALHHHARWDGKGYTGSAEIETPAGEDIPVWARIVAIADVYDALVSKRCYKEPWASEKAAEILRKDAGSHFDPELVKHFEEIGDTIAAIYGETS